jgi:hypothetical protein
VLSDVNIFFGRQNMRNTTNLNTSLVLLIVMTISSVAVAIDYNSVGSGVWYDEDAWNPSGVPGPDDNVVIEPNHIIGAREAGDVYLGSAFTTIGANSITISENAVLSAHFPPNGWMTAAPRPDMSGGRFRGAGLVICCRFLTNNGEIRGERGGPQHGGDIHIWPIDILTWGNRVIEGEFINNGTIIGGSGSEVGGSVFIGRNGDPLWNNWHSQRDAVIRTMTNNGLIKGGDTGHEYGGLVRVEGIDASNTGQIVGGDAHGTAGGTVRFWGQDNVTNEGLVKGGNNYPVPSDYVTAYGGDVFVGSRGNTTNAAGASIISGDGPCAGAVLVFGVNKDLRGTIQPGHRYDSSTPLTVIIDPVQGQITGDANISAEDITIAAENWLTIGDFNDANAIIAEHDIIITIAPGGTLDMRNNPAGTTVINAANDVTIWAPNLLLDDGVTLQDIISAGGSITHNSSGKRLTSIHGDPNQTFYTYKALSQQSEGITIRLPISNLGNMSETVDYQVQTQGKTGWASPSSTSGYIALGPMDSNSVEVDVNVPGNALPADSVTITMTLKRQGHSEVEDSTNVTVMVCPYAGDFDHDGAVDYNDLSQFTERWLTTTENPDNWYGNLDVSEPNDSAINFKDFGRAAENWMFGK